MPRSLAEPTKRYHVHIYKTDYDRLVELHGDNVGVSNAIRMLIRSYLQEVAARTAQTSIRPEIPDELTIGQGRSTES